MALKIITSWRTLMLYAKAVGDARVVFSKDPSEKNREALDHAIVVHEDYRQMCLRADEMIHTPRLDLRGP